MDIILKISNRMSHFADSMKIRQDFLVCSKYPSFLRLLSQDALQCESTKCIKSLGAFWRALLSILALIKYLKSGSFSPSVRHTTVLGYYKCMEFNVNVSHEAHLSLVPLYWCVWLTPRWRWRYWWLWCQSHSCPVHGCVWDSISEPLSVLVCVRGVRRPPGRVSILALQA